MNAIRASKGAEEARKHASTLQRLTAATRASMEQHVRAEEQEVRRFACSGSSTVSSMVLMLSLVASSCRSAQGHVSADYSLNPDRWMLSI